MTLKPRRFRTRFMVFTRGTTCGSARLDAQAELLRRHDHELGHSSAERRPWCMGLDRQWPVEIAGTGVFPAANSFWNVLLEFDVKYKYAEGIEIIYRTEKPYMRFEGDRGWIDAGFNHFEASDESLLEKELRTGR